MQVELDSAQFVTRTYVTTYTLVETSTSREHVVSNVATEQLSPAGATSTPLSSGKNTAKNNAFYFENKEYTQ